MTAGADRTARLWRLFSSTRSEMKDFDAGDQNASVDLLERARTAARRLTDPAKGFGHLATERQTAAGGSGWRRSIGRTLVAHQLHAVHEEPAGKIITKLPARARHGRSQASLAGFCCSLAPASGKTTVHHVGATKLHHLDDALASVSVKLSADEITSLEEPYVPHAVVGFV
jgi:aryl-alcohol dehydrogenase-like predicted oxidoreductase